MKEWLVMSVVLVLAALLALHLTGCGNDLSMVDASNRSTRSLLRAAKAGRKSSVRRQVGAGVDINVRDAQGRTALPYASLNGHNEMVEMLLALGAERNVQDDEGNTPLHLAARSDHEDTCRALLTAGADRALRNEMNQTPADVAYGDSLHLVRD